jgi:hypothetical protein
MLDTWTNVCDNLCMTRTVVRLKDLKRGMVVVPYKGVSFKVKDEDLDWGPALASAFWQHVVMGENPITLVRHYVVVSEYTRTPLLGHEMYNPNHSDTPYLLLGWAPIA